MIMSEPTPALPREGEAIREVGSLLLQAESAYQRIILNFYFWLA